MRVRQGPRPAWTSHHFDGELHYTLLWEFWAGRWDISALRSYPAALNSSTTLQRTKTRATARAIILYVHACPWSTMGMRPCTARAIVTVYLHIPLSSSHRPISLYCTAVAAGGWAWLPSLTTFNYIKLH